MLKAKFDPNTNVLIVETNRTERFEGTISIGSWTPIVDAAGDTIFHIVVEEDGEDYIFNIEGEDLEEGLDEKYDISDILSAESYEVVKFESKYLLVDVKIRNGEYEYYSKSLHIVDRDADNNEIGNQHAKGFYGNFSHEDDETYYFNGGEVATQLYQSEEISKSDYRVLRKFIS